MNVVKLFLTVFTHFIIKINAVTNRKPFMRKTKQEAQKTRQHLLNAALEIFWRMGVTRATLQEIAQQAGVTRGALYWHFSNKEALFESLFEQHYSVFMEKLDDGALNNAADVWEHLRQSLFDLFRLLEENEQQRKFCQVMFLKCEQTESNQTLTELAGHYHSVCRRQIARALQLSQAQGRLPEHADIELAAIYLESNLVGLLKMWSNDTSRFALSETARKVIDASMQTLQAGFLK